MCRIMGRGKWLGGLVKRLRRRIIGRLQTKRSEKEVCGWIYGGTKFDALGIA